MEYIEVLWHHTHPDDPVRLISELDGQRYETRKLEIDRNGNAGYASATFEKGTTQLGTVPLPLLYEINKDPQFQAKLISKEAFEELWKQWTADN